MAGDRFERRQADPDAPVGLDAPSGRYVDTDDGLEKLVEELCDEPEYAIDTEFHRERTYFAHLALLQIAWPGGIALVDPLSTNVKLLAPILEGPGIAVLHAADQDLEVLDRECGCVPSRLFDTQLAAGFLGFSSPSLQSLLERLLGRALQKGDQLTDWTRRPLTSSQLAYAAGDVAYLLELYHLESDRLERAGRLSWALEECAIELSRSRELSEPSETWWRLRQSRQLRGRARGVAQEITAWRERRARALDRPVRTVLSDLAIVSIANNPPRTRAGLFEVRSLESRHLEAGAGAEILDAIEAGLSLSSDRVRLPPSVEPPNIAKSPVALVAAWVSERARTLEIDPAILATHADLAMYLREPPSGRLATTWRADIVGEPIQALLNGDASLALSNGTLVLERRSHAPFEDGLSASADLSTLTDPSTLTEPT